MNPFDVEYIAHCGRSCEDWLTDEVRFVAAGRFLEAAECAEHAELESRRAFDAAELYRFPAPPAESRSPCRGVAGAGGDSIETGRAGAV
jgi:hypothetical protein